VHRGASDDRPAVALIQRQIERLPYITILTVSSLIRWDASIDLVFSSSAVYGSEVALDVPLWRHVRAFALTLLRTRVWHRCTTVEVYCTALIAYRRACHDHKVRVTHFQTLLLLLLLLKDVPPSVRSGSDRDQRWGRCHSPCCRTIILEWSRYF
jgi:hypothetical protein